LRVNGRGPKELRDIKIIRDYLKYAEGSVLIEWGQTRVICSATVEDKVPNFLKNSQTGWVTAEYSLLPRATKERNIRDSVKGRIGGRSHEIQRLIGRSLRAVTDLTGFGERTIWIDCDVIQADGGTRSACITGAYIALVDAFNMIQQEGWIESIPLIDSVAAVSVGIVENETLLDLNYEEDSIAQVDMNIVMTGSGKFVEVQGTAEKEAFGWKEMEDMLKIAAKGIEQITEMQKKIIGEDWNFLK